MFCWPRAMAQSSLAARAKEIQARVPVQPLVVHPSNTALLGDGNMSVVEGCTLEAAHYDGAAITSILVSPGQNCWAC